MFLTFKMLEVIQYSGLKELREKTTLWMQPIFPVLCLLLRNHILLSWELSLYPMSPLLISERIHGLFDSVLLATMRGTWTLNRSKWIFSCDFLSNASQRESQASQGVTTFLHETWELRDPCGRNLYAVRANKPACRVGRRDEKSGSHAQETWIPLFQGVICIPHFLSGFLSLANKSLALC